MLKVLEREFRGNFWVLARNMFDRDLRIQGQLDQVVAKWDGFSFICNDIAGDFAMFLPQASARRTLRLSEPSIR